MKYIFFILIIVSANTLLSQINKKYFLGYSNSIFSNLIVRDKNLYVSGYMFQKVPTVTSGGFIGKISFEGDSLFEKRYIDTPSTKRTTWWDNNVISSKNNDFLIACNMQKKARVMKIDTLGNILKSTDYMSYFTPQNTDLFAYNIFEDVDSIVWIISNCRANDDLNYLQITQFNQNLDSLKKVYIGNPSYFKWARNFIKIDANTYLIAGSYNNDGLFGNFKNIKTGDFFIKVDKNCNLLSEYYVPASKKLGGMGDMVYEEKDSSYIMFGSDCYEITIDIFGYLYYYPMVYKLNKNYQMVWQTKMGNGRYDGGNTSINIRKSIENDGYVFSGELYDTFKVNRLDTYGTFGKVSLKGDSLWLRQYRLFEDTTSYVSGEIYEIQPSHDGGYYLSGSSIGGPKLEDKYQGGWLLKVDKFGCLVPGCEQPSALPVLEQSKIHYQFYPNPAQDVLNVFLESTQSKQILVKFCDSFGMPLKIIQHTGTETTYILPVSNYVSGTYYLEFWEENKLLKSEKVILIK